MPVVYSSEFVEAFWARVDKSGDCWLWMGARNKKTKYGTLGRLYAHRLAYELLIGSIYGIWRKLLRVIRFGTVSKMAKSNNLSIGMAEHLIQDCELVQTYIMTI